MEIQTPRGTFNFPKDYIAQPDPESPTLFYIAPFTGESVLWKYIGPSAIQTTHQRHDPVALVMRDIQFMELDLLKSKERNKLMALLIEIMVYDTRGTIANRASKIQYTIDSLEKKEDWEKYDIRLIALEKEVEEITLYQAEDDILEEKARQEEGYIAQPQEEQDRLFKKLTKPKPKKKPAKKRKSRAKKKVVKK